MVESKSPRAASSRLKPMPDGCWITTPPDVTIARAGEWFTFLPLFPLSFFGRTIVYGRLHPSGQSVSIELKDLGDDVTGRALMAGILSKTQLRTVDAGGGNFTIQIVTEEIPLRPKPLRSSERDAQ